MYKNKGALLQNMALRQTTFAGVLAATDHFEGSGSGLSANSVPRASVANGTASHVVINAAVTGALDSEAQLALSRGGTNAALTADGSDLTFLCMQPLATSVSKIVATDAAIGNTAVVRNADGGASFSGTSTIGGDSAETLVAPTGNGVAYTAAHVSTTAGVTADMLSITTAAGYAGMVKCSVVAGNATLSEHRAAFDAIWSWKRVGATVEFTSTAPYKLIDKSDALADYDLTCALSGTSIIVRATHGAGLATTLYWTGRFDVINTKLS